MSKKRESAPTFNLQLWGCRLLWSPNWYEVKGKGLFQLPRFCFGFSPNTVGAAPSPLDQTRRLKNLCLRRWNSLISHDRMHDRPNHYPADALCCRAGVAVLENKFVVVSWSVKPAWWKTLRAIMEISVLLRNMIFGLFDQFMVCMFVLTALLT